MDALLNINSKTVAAAEHWLLCSILQSSTAYWELDSAFYINIFQYFIIKCQKTEYCARLLNFVILKDCSIQVILRYVQEDTLACDKLLLFSIVEVWTGGDQALLSKNVNQDYQGVAGN